MDSRIPYPSDVSDDEWAFVAPYLTLLPQDISQRRYSLREVFNGSALDCSHRLALALAAA
jgi:transposase